MISGNAIIAPIETSIAKIWMEEEIIFVKFIDKLDMTLEKAQSAVEARLSVCAGISYPVLVDMRGIRSVTREAREYLAGEGTRLIKAGALLVESPLSRTLGNIFLWINKPEVPTRLFSDEKEAKEWLKKF